jgi:hypothetical protein
MFFEDLKLDKTKFANLSGEHLIDDFIFSYDEKSYSLFTDAELIAAVGSVLVFDVECYINYFLVAFKHVETKRVVYFEITDYVDLDRSKLGWILQNFCIVGFNSRNYDLLVLTLAMYGYGRKELKKATNDIILDHLWIVNFEQKWGIKVPTLNHIDLIEVAPLKASLKLYGGRLHSPRMQELPIKHDAILTDKEIRFVRLYCINDLDVTAILYTELRPQLLLREQMSLEYKQDLRSRSDAQLAEHVITGELARLNGYRPKRPEIAAGTKFQYKIPHFVQYKTEHLQAMLEIVRNAEFIVGEDGAPELPKELKELTLQIGESSYRMGIGGLHSSEKCIAHRSDDNYMLIDKDVASYYPSIILNLELYPKHLGKSFLKVYRNIVDRRLEAKRTGNKVVNDSLKITINGSFGKLGNKYSALYSPDLLIQVTMTGQLCLLMLIEMIESVGIQVVSANTDGMVVKCHKDRYLDLESWVIYWQQVTGFITEETRYKAIYNRDVNNYIAIKEDGKFKVKGTYSERGSAGDSILSKNPESLICNDAVVQFLINKTPIEKTIRECKDIRRFVTIRTVKGGAEKSGVYLGKAVRWYYSKTIKGEINYVTSGNKVPNSDNAMPLMDLPTELPDDIDFEYYIAKANEILKEIGYGQRHKMQASLF